MPTAATPQQPQGSPVAFIANPAQGDQNNVTLGQASDLVLRIVNRTSQAIVVPNGGSIRIDFTPLGETVTVDAANVTATGFAATSPVAGVIELAVAGNQYVWPRGQAIYVALNGVVIQGNPGAGLIGLTLTNMVGAPVWQTGVAMATFAPPAGALAGVAVQNGSRLARIRYTDGATGGALSVSITPAAGAATGTASPVLLVGVPVENADQLQALTSPEYAAGITVTAPGWTATPIAGSSTPWWTLTPNAGTALTAPVQIDIGNLVTTLPVGTGSLMIGTIGLPNTTDACHVMAVAIDNDTPQITSFTATAPQGQPYTAIALNNLTAPVPLTLSWTTTGAGFVTLSGYGLVGSSVSGFPVTVERSTNFVLTTFDASLNPGPSSTVSVTVTPEPTTMGVPPGAIAAWSGTVATIPAGWLLCDGQSCQTADYPLLSQVTGTVYGSTGSGTFAVPDLQEYFIIGASADSAAKPQQNAPADSHTHTIGSFKTSTTKTSNAGSHNHKFPSGWYHRAISSGDYTVFGNVPSSASLDCASGGNHSHTVSVEIDPFSSESNLGGIRPPWYALCYIIKT